MIDYVQHHLRTISRLSATIYFAKMPLALVTSDIRLPKRLCPTGDEPRPRDLTVARPFKDQHLRLVGKLARRLCL
jgi:hypothetical protein